MEIVESLSIAILVFVILTFIIVCLIYYKILELFEFSIPEVPPPPGLRFSDSFLT